jgi:hypothetical protein
VVAFDQALYESITINGDNDIGNAESIWHVFSGRFGRIHGLVSYLPVFSAWLKDAFRFLINGWWRECVGGEYEAREYVGTGVSV